MPICIYPPLAEDFTTNGLGILTPLECTVEEQAAGKYEIELVHPIDSTLRWMQIQNGCIVKVPAPVRENPLYEAPAIEAAAPVTVTRQVWRATDGQHIRQKPDRLSKKMGSVRKGGEVIELADAHDPWKKICAVKGGQVGYMSTRYLKAVRTITETIQPAKPPVVVGSVEINQSRDQLFRIYSVEQDSEAGTVTAKGMHVFYDDAGNLINTKYEPKNAAVATVMSKIASSLHQAAEVDFQAFNLTGKITGDFSYKTPVEAYLDPDEGIVAQTGAMLFRDNWEAYLLPDMVRDLGVTIRRGKNLIGVEVTNDISDVVTRIIPIGKNKNGDPLGLSGTKYVDSSHINKYPFPRVKRIEYDVQTGKDGFNSDDAVRKELERLAKEDFKNGADLPTYGMDVDFVLLQNTAEYENFASLQAVHLYDTVTVIDEMLGLKAKVRVTGYKWNCLTEQYESVTLGELQDVKQTVYSFNLPNKGVSGNKIMNNSLDGTAMRDASIEYAKITTAAIEQLSASAITALTARIQEIVAQKLTTDQLYAAYAEMIALKVGTITADNIQTDNLAAELARITVLAAGTADFNQATIRHLVAQAMNLEFGTVGQVFIKNLAVEYAQMVGATIGELCIKASDGNYYIMDVNPDGTVTATKTTVSSGEASAGQTSGGKFILETNITAANLNAGNLLATYALINQIDAARIDVDQLFAREAFVNLLRTSKIVGDKSITMLAGEVDNLDRLSNIEVIEGTFAQTERREGEGIRIYSEINPKQDLKWGAPWPGGAGKNLWNNSASALGHSTTKTETGFSFVRTTSGGSYVYYRHPLRAGDTVTFSAKFDNYVMDMYIYEKAIYGTQLAFNRGAGRITYTANADYPNATFAITIASAQGDCNVSDIQIEYGSVVTDYAPYSNTPPIEGWTGLNAFAGGKNLLKNDATSQTLNGVTITVNEDGSVICSGTSTATFTTTISNKTIPAGRYILSGCPAGGAYSGDGSYRLQADITMADGTIKYISDIGSGATFTLNETPVSVSVFIILAKNGIYDELTFNPMLRVAHDVDAVFQPYQGSTYFLDFGETVYGGKVDWHSGEMTVEWGTYTLTGTGSAKLLSASVYNAKCFMTDVIPNMMGNSDALNEAKSSHFVEGVWNSIVGMTSPFGKFAITTSNKIGIAYDGTIAEANAWLASQHTAGTPVQFVWKLAEPYTIQLTPVQIETLQGINTVYTNADGGRVEFGHSPIEDIQNAVDALEEAQAESALYLKLDAENKVVRIGQTEVTSEFDIDAYGAGVVVGGKVFSRFEGERVLIGDMEMRKPANIGGLAFDSIMT